MSLISCEACTLESARATRKQVDEWGIFSKHAHLPRLLTPASRNPGKKNEDQKGWGVLFCHGVTPFCTKRACCLLHQLILSCQFFSLILSFKMLFSCCTSCCWPPVCFVETLRQKVILI